MKASLTTLDAACSAQCCLREVVAAERQYHRHCYVLSTRLEQKLLGKLHFVYLCRRDVFALLKSQLETLSQSCDVAIAE